METNDLGELDMDVVHIRTIERIYGERGTEIIEAMYGNPALVVPIVLKRLRQKSQEWSKIKQDWQEPAT